MAEEACLELRECVKDAQEILATSPEDDEAQEALAEAQAALAELEQAELASNCSTPTAAPATTPHGPLDAAHTRRLAYLTRTPDFRELAAKYPYFKHHVKDTPAGPRLAFTSWRATHALTQALFEDGFGVEGWAVPEGHLVPALPNRMNYLLWLADLLALSSRALAMRVGEASVRGLDIGCGANLVYSLLAASAFGWHMAAVDTDCAAIAAAARVLDANPHMQSSIRLHAARGEHDGASPPHSAARPRSPGGGPPCADATAQHGTPAATDPAEASDARHSILSGDVRALGPFDFCVCNPPFFEAVSDAHQNPDTAHGGTAAEMACAGGEAGFVEGLIRESAAAPMLCHWFSSMLGKKATFRALRQRLHATAGVTAVRSTELAQGRTHRWALAWSFVVDGGVARAPLPATLPRCGEVARPQRGKRPRSGGHKDGGEG